MYPCALQESLVEKFPTNRHKTIDQVKHCKNKYDNDDYAHLLVKMLLYNHINKYKYKSSIKIQVQQIEI